MGQETKQMPPEEIGRIILKIQNRGGYSNEQMNLVREDLERGISREQINQYLTKKYDIRQMRIYSNCLRRGCSDDELKAVCRQGLDADQMEVLYGFLEHGISVDVMRQIAEEAEYVPARMKAAYEKLENLRQADLGRLSKTDIDCMKELTNAIRTFTEKMSSQESRYEEFTKKLDRYETAKEETERQHLYDELSAKDKQLEAQQDQLNQANSALARLRREKECVEGELARLKAEMQIVQKKTDKKKEEPPLDPVVQSGNNDPVSYQLQISSGKSVGTVSFEPMKRDLGGSAGMLAKLAFKKKSRADIVRLVASGDLIPAQLVQIKHAIERGLTEKQLVELINNKVPAEKMKEIIEIAVLENGMA